MEEQHINSNTAGGEENRIMLDMEDFFDKNIDTLSFLMKVKLNEENDEIKNLFVEESKKLICSSKENFLSYLYILKENEEKSKTVFDIVLSEKNTEHILLLKNFLLKRIKITVKNNNIAGGNEYENGYFFNINALKAALSDVFKGEIDSEEFKNELLKFKIVLEDIKDNRICQINDLDCRLFFISESLKDIKKEIEKNRVLPVQNGGNTAYADFSKIEKKIEQVETFISENLNDAKTNFDDSLLNIREEIKQEIKNISEMFSNAATGTGKEYGDKSGENISEGIDKLSGKIEIILNKLNGDKEEDEGENKEKIISKIQEDFKNIVNDINIKIDAVNDNLKKFEEKIGSIEQQMNSINVEEFNSFIKEEKEAVKKADELINQIKNKGEKK